MPTRFENELRELLNRHSVENDSNTPDFILAKYLTACIYAWNAAIQQREIWYGRDGHPSTKEGWQAIKDIAALDREAVDEAKAND